MIAPKPFTAFAALAGVAAAAVVLTTGGLSAQSTTSSAAQSTTTPSTPVQAPASSSAPEPRLWGGRPTGPAIVTSFSNAMLMAPPASLALDPFYTQYADAYGIPIVASAKVRSDAVLMARDIVNYMLLKRYDVRQDLIRRGARVLVMAISEGEMDLPERRDWKKPAFDDRRLTQGERDRYHQPGGIASMTDSDYWNNRARGMGGTITSCGEENVLGIPGTRYFGEHILVHEFSHNIMGSLRTVDRPLYDQIQVAFDAAKAKGLYKDSRGQAQYAINTVAEYFAEGTQWWFWSNIEFYDGTTKARVQSPEDLAAYDPALFAILDRVYAGHHVPADVYHGKNLRPARAPGILVPARR